MTASQMYISTLTSPVYRWRQHVTWSWVLKRLSWQSVEQTYPRSDKDGFAKYSAVRSGALSTLRQGVGCGFYLGWVVPMIGETGPIASHLATQLWGLDLRGQITKWFPCGSAAAHPSLRARLHCRAQISYPLGCDSEWGFNDRWSLLFWEFQKKKTSVLKCS